VSLYKADKSQKALLKIAYDYIYRVCQKRRHRHITVTDLEIFFTARFFSKFAVKWILNIPLAYVATLPCETLMSAKQASNDKLQNSVATYLRCGGVLNNQIKKLLSVRVKNFVTGKYLDSDKQERGCLMHFARLANTLLKHEESARDNHILAAILFTDVKIFFTLRLSNKPLLIWLLTTPPHHNMQLHYLVICHCWLVLLTLIFYKVA